MWHDNELKRKKKVTDEKDIIRKNKPQQIPQNMQVYK